jgi:hypothetical protein
MEEGQLPEGPARPPPGASYGEAYPEYPAAVSTHQGARARVCLAARALVCSRGWGGGARPGRGTPARVPGWHGALSASGRGVGKRATAPALPAAGRGRRGDVGAPARRASQAGARQDCRRRGRARQRRAAGRCLAGLWDHRMPRGPLGPSPLAAARGWEKRRPWHVASAGIAARSHQAHRRPLLLLLPLLLPRLGAGAYA